MPPAFRLMGRWRRELGPDCGTRDKAVSMKDPGSTAGILVRGLQVDGGGDTRTPGSFVCCEVANLEYSFSLARFKFC